MTSVKEKLLDDPKSQINISNKERAVASRSLEIWYVLPSELIDKENIVRTLNKTLNLDKDFQPAKVFEREKLAEALFESSSSLFGIKDEKIKARAVGFSVEMNGRADRASDDGKKLMANLITFETIYAPMEGRIFESPTWNIGSPMSDAKEIKEFINYFSERQRQLDEQKKVIKNRLPQFLLPKVHGDLLLVFFL